MPVVSPTSSSFFSVFLRETAQVVTGHTPTRTCFAVSLSVFVSRRVCFCPFWLCVPLLGVFSGCHSGPRAFLGFSLDLLRPFSWDARRQGCFSASCALFCFSPFRSVLRPHTFSRSPSRLSSRSGQPRVGFLSRKGHNIGWSRPPLARVRARGSASRAEGWSPPVSGFLTASFSSHRSQGPLGPFLHREGALYLPPHRPSFTRTFFCFPAPGFFLFFFLQEMALRAQPGLPDAIVSNAECRIQSVAPRTPRNAMWNPCKRCPP